MHNRRIVALQQGAGPAIGVRGGVLLLIGCRGRLVGPDGLHGDFDSAVVQRPDRLGESRREQRLDVAVLQLGPIDDAARAMGVRQRAIDAYDRIEPQVEAASRAGLQGVLPAWSGKASMPNCRSLTF